MKDRRTPARLIAALALLAGAPLSSGATPFAGPWVSTWGTAVSNPGNDIFYASTAYLGTNEFNNQTIRLIAHLSLGGEQVRVRLTNEEGTTPVFVGAAHLALSAGANNIAGGTDRTLTFGGAPGVTLPAGAIILSDPVALDVPAGGDLAVSLYLPGDGIIATAHPYAVQTGFVAPPGSGDTTGTASLPPAPVQAYINEWPLLAGIEVKAPGAGTVVAFGSSVTAGFDTTMDANARWPDFLAARLRKHGRPVAVINTSITGNHLITETNGRDAVSRFDRDVLARPGVKYVILADSPGLEVSAGLGNTSDDIIAACKQLILRAHSRNVKIIGTTAIPVYNFVTYSPANEAARQTINAFMRTTTLFDAVVDFDAILRDPNNPIQLDAAYDSGDHHHPNDAGHARLAAAFPLDFFQ